MILKWKKNCINVDGMEKGRTQPQGYKLLFCSLPIPIYPYFVGHPIL